ncbi:MAG TPA: AraC family transcriptional regulator [Kofleriaceae bacterium]|nr:AraC family transcriptional regulator [Kofleriaceae bacterium]
MLSAESHLEFASSTLRSNMFLERQMRVHLVSRDRLQFDSAYASPTKGVGHVHLFVQLSGTVVPTYTAGAPAAPVAAPCAFVLSEPEFDHVQPGTPTFRSFGERCTIVEARVPPSELRLPVGLARGPVPLPPPVWDALEHLRTAPSEASVFQMIGALGDTGVISRGLAASVVADEPERFKRIWAAMRPLYQNLATSASLKQISTLTGLSLRQLGRDFTELTRTFGLFGAGFREAMRAVRLRVATLLLSAPDATPSDVARVVGYGSLDAMGRAFRDATLPAPSIVQEAVRFRGV